MRILLALLPLAVLMATPAPAAEVKVFAAASLKTALDEINKGQSAAGVYAASSALAKQIIEGAPADVYISADLAWMDALENKGLIKPATRRNLLGNSLVLVAAAGSGLKVELKSGVNLLGLLKGGRLAIGETTAVPAGRYAKAALETFGIWDQLSPHLAQQINVRAALQLVARGETPLGIVYASDAKADASVEIAGVFPDSSHPPIIYPAAVIASSTNPRAEAYLMSLASAAAQEIFTRQGFAPLGAE